MAAVCMQSYFAVIKSISDIGEGWGSDTMETQIILGRHNISSNIQTMYGQTGIPSPG